MNWHSFIHSFEKPGMVVKAGTTVLQETEAGYPCEFKACLGYRVRTCCTVWRQSGKEWRKKGGKEERGE